MRLSNFNLYVGASDGNIIVRNTRTGGVVKMSKSIYVTLVSGGVSHLPTSLVSTLEHSGIIVHDSKDEYRTWTEQVFDMRDYHAELFTLHFIPTIQCQLRCMYCFENGVDRGHSMTTETFESGVNWVDTYLYHHPELKRFKLIFFGGEPLLCKKLVLKACESYQKVVSRYGLDFQVELVTNGELLTLDFVKRFAVYPWRRVQITLDGECGIHNARRPGNNDRDVFEIITTNIKNLLDAKVLPHVNIRLSFDLFNADSVARLLDTLVAYGDPKHIRLSLGFITDTFEGATGTKFDIALIDKALLFWERAKELGFEIPKEQIFGPLCVAAAKHSAVFTPDGGMQKCFATVGRKEYDFGTVHVQPLTYTQDTRYEQWKRMDECVTEKCSVLPICGGGCPNDAMIAYGGAGGGATRFCQKGFLLAMNEGLLRIKYGR